MENRGIKIVCLLAFLAVVCMGELSVLVLDFSGEYSRFTDPDGILGEVRPIEAVNATFENLTTAPSAFVMNAELSVTYSSRLPVDLDDYNIIYLLNGWRGSGGMDLTIDQRSRLSSFVLSHTPESQRALIVEGNDYCYKYADTSSGHYTWHSSSDIFGCVLRSDHEPAFDYLYGWHGSIAEDLVFEYPGYGEPGPGYYPDDIEINEESFFSEHATYLFDGGSKGPARGMQRRGFSPGTGSVAGATIMLPFVMGNLKDGERHNTKAEFLYRMLDFCTMPIAEFIEDFTGRVLMIDSTYEISFVQYDAVYVTEVTIEYSTDAGEVWLEIFHIEPEFELSSMEWTVPERESDECFLRLTVKDRAGNAATELTGPFAVSYEAVKEDILPKSISLKAFPNPFNSALNIRGEKGSEIAIYDVFGNTVFEHVLTAGYAIWRPDHLPSGVYNVQSTSSQGIEKQTVLFLK